MKLTENVPSTYNSVADDKASSKYLFDKIIAVFPSCVVTDSLYTFGIILQFSKISHTDANVSGTGGRFFSRSRCMVDLICGKLIYCAASGLLEKQSI